MTGRGGSDLSRLHPYTGAPRSLSVRAKWQKKLGIRISNFVDSILPWGTRALVATVGAI